MNIVEYREDREGTLATPSVGCVGVFRSAVLAHRVRLELTNCFTRPGWHNCSLPPAKGGSDFNIQAIRYPPRSRKRMRVENPNVRSSRWPIVRTPGTGTRCPDLGRARKTPSPNVRQFHQFLIFPLATQISTCTMSRLVGTLPPHKTRSFHPWLSTLSPPFVWFAHNAVPVTRAGSPRRGRPPTHPPISRNPGAPRRGPGVVRHCSRATDQRSRNEASATPGPQARPGGAAGQACPRRRDGSSIR